ncbi:hypothetical protein [Glycomyces harbinensis]|uniref:Alkaline shock response membrane anchor protein AmaP n=1 Tax=Glycomyces harbinensis TaxID=58114 RepID=A0A1G6V4D3_9ACTN|nr:hypothetical protein [Glycomyces harbinensis]SDD47837.1 hypothetical protein SAMN05216270_104173 [Glycomyces harbinensis]
MRTLAIDRVGAALLGLVLLAAGAAVVDWRFDLVGAWDRLDTGLIRETVEADWFAWAAGGAAVVLAVVALWWLFARVPRPVESGVRLGFSGADRVDVDVRSIAPRLRESLEQSAPVDHVTSSRSRTGTGQLVLLRANVDPRADGESLRRAADDVAASVEAAFPDREVTVRILIDAPRRRGKRRTPRVH